MVTSSSGSVLKVFNFVVEARRGSEARHLLDNVVDHDVPEKVPASSLKRRFHGVSIGCNGDWEGVLFDPVIKLVNLNIGSYCVN
jgi:hypothetical protein